MSTDPRKTPLVRPTQTAAIELAVRLAPEYAEALRELQGSNGGRLQFPKELRSLLHWSGPLVLLHEDDQTLQNVLAVGLMREEGFNDWVAYMGSLTDSQQAEYLDELIANRELDSPVALNSNLMAGIHA